eukprot:9913453-Alexandrium_andersonii.AAC.1
MAVRHAPVQPSLRARLTHDTHSPSCSESTLRTSAHRSCATSYKVRTIGAPNPCRPSSVLLRK